MAKQTDNEVARRVRIALDAEGLSGRRLAADLGKSAPYIARRLSGEVEFSISDLKAISSRLLIPVAEFITSPLSAQLTGADRGDSLSSAA